MALAIVSVTTVGALSAVAGAFRTAERARHVLVAQALAEQRVHAIELLALDSDAHLPDSLARGAFGAPLGDYRWTASTRTRPGEPEVTELDVRVEWDDGAYVLQTRAYRTARVVAP